MRLIRVMRVLSLNLPGAFRCKSKEFPMYRFTKYLVGAAAIGGLATPALAQYYPGQSYPQGYQQGYGQQGYGQNPIQQVIDQLLGNRYNVSDRTAVSRCAAAVVAQASQQYRPQYSQGYNRYGQPYGQQQYAQPYASSARVTAITNVERRSSGLRVTGMLDSGRFPTAYGNPAYGQQPYGQAYGYNPNQPYAAAAGDRTFRCNVDYRGAVTNVRINQNRSYRRY